MPAARRTVAAPGLDAEDAATDDPAAQVLRQFRQVANTVKNHFQQAERNSGLGGAQVWALSVVQARPGLGVGELADALDIHPSTASNLVRALTGKGLLQARREGADRRAVQLHLLAAGTRALKKLPSPFEGLLPAALRQLDAATLRRLHKDLDKLIRLLGADERSGWIPLSGL